MIKTSDIPNEAKSFLPLWPSILGLGVARSAAVVSSYGSYTSTDEGFFTDGSMLVAFIFLIAIMLYLGRKKSFLTKTLVNRVCRVTAVLQALSLFALAYLDAAGNDNLVLRFAISVIASIAASLALYYWFRRARGAHAATAAIFVFAALIFSEIEIYLCTLVPPFAGYALAGALALLQIPCLKWARNQIQPYDIEPSNQESGYFGYTRSFMSNARYLLATAFGIACLSFVIGMLRGYPDGQPIAFMPSTRLAYALLTIAVSAVLIFLVLKQRRNTMTIGIWLIMQVLACLALIAYAAFPDNLDIGAVFTTTLNAMMMTFAWYIAISFMSYGNRDPLFYAIAIDLIWLGSRGIARVILYNLHPINGNDMLMNALMAGLLVASTVMIFVKFFGITEQQQEEQDLESQAKQSALEKLMGLEGGDLSDMRSASMRHNAEELGRQFFLSDREIEVLTLYALGFTQKRVAEELFISPSTAHAHIKRIYAKTGMHSRQEIIDYLKKYAT